MRLLSPRCLLSSTLLSLLHLVHSEPQVPLAAALQKPLQNSAEPSSTAIASALTLTTIEHITSTKYNIVAIVTMTRPENFVPTCRVHTRHSERALADSDMSEENQSSSTMDTLIETITTGSTTVTFACSIDPLIPQCMATQSAIAASKAAASESTTDGSMATSTSSALTASVSDTETSLTVSPISASSVSGSSLSHSTATTATSPVTGHAGTSRRSSTTTMSGSNTVSSITADTRPTVTLVTTVVSVSVLRVEETTYSIASTTTVTVGPSSSTEAASAAVRTRFAGGRCSVLALLSYIFFI